RRPRREQGGRGRRALRRGGRRPRPPRGRGARGAPRRPAARAARPAAAPRLRRSRVSTGSDPKASEPRAPDPTPAEQRLDAEGMRLLLEVSRRINAERDPESLLAAVVDSLVSVTKADRGFLMLKEGAGLRF